MGDYRQEHSYAPPSHSSSSIPKHPIFTKTSQTIGHQNYAVNPNTGASVGIAQYGAPQVYGQHQARRSGSPSLSVYNGGGMENVKVPISFIAAFGSGGLPGEPSLLEELGVNLTHIRMKTFSVLNPFKSLDREIMEDTDLAGPLIFCLLFGMSLLFAGKVHFGYIYGVGLAGGAAIYAIMNAMSEKGVGPLHTASILGYCLLPMVLLSCLSVFHKLQNVIGLILGGMAVLWCTVSGANMFVTALSMREQRALVAYPVGLFYFCFALITVF